MSKAAPAALRPVEETEARQQREDKVLTPEIHSTSISIGEYRVDLRPLTIRFAKQLKAILDPVTLQIESLEASEAVLNAMGEIQEAYTKALCVLGQFYKVPLNTEWIEETLTPGEVRDVLEKQLELSRANDHLLLSLRQTLLVIGAVLQTMNTMSQAQYPGNAPSTPASAKPGDAPLLTSSSDTLPAN